MLLALGAKRLKSTVSVHCTVCTVGIRVCRQSVVRAALQLYRETFNTRDLPCPRSATICTERGDAQTKDQAGFEKMNHRIHRICRQ